MPADAARDLRCPGRKHAEIVTPASGGLLDIKCDSRLCGARPGVVIIHRFATDGRLVDTTRYRTPTAPERT